MHIQNFSQDDWNELQEMIKAYQSTELSRYEPPWPTSNEEVKEIASWFSSDDEYLKVIQKTTGNIIGLLAINKRKELEGRFHNLGFIFHPKVQGQGFATEACKSIISYLFTEIQIDGFVTGTHPDNKSSVSLLYRLGFNQKVPASDEYLLNREEWKAN